MSAHVLDTNALVRLLVGDNPTQRNQAEQWLKQAEQGQRIIAVTPVVIAETSFVLESFYKLKRDDIADALEVFVAQRWLKVEERDILCGLWPYYRQRFHFVDSYLRAWSVFFGGDILTFDKKLRKS